MPRDVLKLMFKGFILSWFLRKDDVKPMLEDVVKLMHRTVVKLMLEDAVKLMTTLSS